MMFREILFLLCLGLTVLALCLFLNHFLPLLLNLDVVPRGSFGWPLVGETLRFLSPHASRTLGDFLEEHISKYGKVFKSHLFCSPTIVSCDLELNHFILQNEEKLFQCCYPKPIHGILGKSSMIVVVGETHRRLRNQALALANTTRSRTSYVTDIERIAIQVMDSWKHKERIIFCEEVRKFAFSVIVKQVLGLSMKEAESAKILEDFLTFMKGLISFPLYIPGTSYARAVQARARISLTVQVIIKERRKNGFDSNKIGDFLDVLLSTNNLSDEEKVSFVLDSLLGGYETTSLLIAMAVYFLGQCPPALNQVKLEHQDISANLQEAGQDMSLEEFKKMEFTQCVIHEALRCGNIVKFVHRKALSNVRFKEYVIPSGWQVLPIFSAVHLDSSSYVDALMFNPWRWEGQTQIISKSFTPFGGGTRLCPGFELAKVEAAIFLHHFVLNYRWRPDGEDIPMAYPYVEFPRGMPILINPI
ncbi:hypothetical protein IEQ34_005098 [Dendrobium chrysotoxum]|uniref:Cytochrome P450 724B1 n=1 Tax=Dendrobium chrysotoxum TaxID=161865 RepID=A0AAV7HA57_DENCH|nr:hypothetical protein IEQ34_005098 [Dendrobium chrysotoxum]